MAVVLFSIIAIIIPSGVLAKINLLEIRNENLSLIWVALIASLCLLISRSFFSLFPVFKGRLNGQIIVHRGKKKLKNLTKAEKEILNKYIQNDTMTQTFDCTDGTVLALEYEHIIYRASIISQGFTDFPYNIQPWVRYYLLKNPSLLK